jgi:hypothetical protein
MYRLFNTFVILGLKDHLILGYGLHVQLIFKLQLLFVGQSLTETSYQCD